MSKYSFATLALAAAATVLVGPAEIKADKFDEEKTTAVCNGDRGFYTLREPGNYKIYLAGKATVAPYEDASICLGACLKNVQDRTEKDAIYISVGQHRDLVMYAREKGGSSGIVPAECSPLEGSNVAVFQSKGMNVAVVVERI